MFLMISCVTSARVCGAAASLHRSSVPVSRACSITASSAGCRFTRGPAASTTNRLSRREPIDRGHFHSGGAEAGRPHATPSTHTSYCSLSVCYFLGFQRFLSIFNVEKFNILYRLACRWPSQWLFYSLKCFKVELFVVKVSIICAISACWFALHCNSYR